MTSLRAALPPGTYIEGRDGRSALNDGRPGDVLLEVVRPLDEELILAVTRDGGRGVLLPSDPPDALIAAVRAAARGETWLSEGTWVRLAGQNRIADKVRARLTKVDLEILGLLAHGLTDAEIAAKRTVTVTTVRHHLRGLRGKLTATSRNQLVALAFSIGLVSPWTVLETVAIDDAP